MIDARRRKFNKNLIQARGLASAPALWVHDLTPLPLNLRLWSHARLCVASPKTPSQGLNHPFRRFGHNHQQTRHQPAYWAPNE